MIVKNRHPPKGACFLGPVAPPSTSSVGASYLKGTALAIESIFLEAQSPDAAHGVCCGSSFFCTDRSQPGAGANDGVERTAAVVE